MYLCNLTMIMIINVKSLLIIVVWFRIGITYSRVKVSVLAITPVRYHGLYAVLNENHCDLFRVLQTIFM